jgi:hypothetical protein
MMRVRRANRRNEESATVSKMVALGVANATMKFEPAICE